ncbi:xylose ABC transporter ATP-binding protein [Paenibacillus thalictri]|uniref:Xylose ABC transporter ATP-binding protein n=1 Tax=Paenibacillus thalictri TaxID=2527873 RepID=A0A4Q9DVN9_9BACL|nr:xylose ABC transporter ATP-binding protein [Paenibacillus thalictri]TBL81117.1 xylose ABC transporter ATP-binding protein [Paenibacillus thalictri]
MSEIALEMRGITKQFPGVRALNDVTFQVKRGQVHALCGENGAGKSTLMKVLSGLYPKGTYEGQIWIDGKEVSFHNVREAEQAGIAIIYQELALVKGLSVGENLFLGNERAKYGIMQWNRVYQETEKWLNEVGLKGIRAEQITGHLGIGQQQLVEIAKALSKNAKILILDEPTAALTEQEVAILLNILREFKKRGVTCIYISHKLNEVFDVCDTITILRDGHTITTEPTAQLSENKVISYMVGRELKELFPYVPSSPGEVALSVQNFSLWSQGMNRKVIDNVSFEVRQGEILGISGLMGAGRTELMMGLFGAYGGVMQGKVAVSGKTVNIRSPQDAIRAGMGLVSEDRKKLGLVLNMDIRKNTSIASLKAVSDWGVINENKEIHSAKAYQQSLRIKANSVETVVGTLSGGNQQKVVLGKWLMTKPKVLILDEPTRGIDVGAKFEIYNIINQLVREGVAIIMISSELPEVMGMSHRIMVLCEGRFTAHFQREEATQEKIMHAATGGK